MRGASKLMCCWQRTPTKRQNSHHALLGGIGRFPAFEVKLSITLVNALLGQLAQLCEALNGAFTVGALRG